VTDSNENNVDAGMVLRRAVELDSTTAQEPAWQGTLDEWLDRTALAEIASEVGVSAAAVAAAVAEAQAGALERPTVIDRIVGPRRVTANRAIAADDEQARERLLSWLSVAHGLRPRVRPDGVIIAHRRRDLAGKMGTGLRRFQGLGGLSSATTVQAAAVGADQVDQDPSDPGAICVVADVGSKRKEAIVGGSAVAAGMSVVVTMAAVFTGPVVLVGIPVAAGLGTVVARKTHRSTVRRMTESVDHTMDGVVQGEEPPHPLGGLVRRRRSGSSG